ncbi:MAG TPA: peptidase S10 [Gammaproteobacteria bacterium]|nr:peptidase S10 [Gammaproteobacteria bacterium]
MNKLSLRAAGVALALIAGPALAAGGGNDHQHDKNAASKVQPPKDQQSVTNGSVEIDGNRIRYKAIAGIMVLKDRSKDDKPYASMSYVAYIKTGVDHQDHRPITFFYNGGPGSSTVWLHMLAFGPKRVVVGNGTLTPPAPYHLVNNSDSLLDATDMVFIDAPGTGFGRVIGKKEGGVGKPKDVWGIDPDAKAFTQFIARWLTEHSRWNSPKFLFGESYGTTRSAVLSYDLEQHNIDLNGVVLLSSILNFDISVDGPQGNPGVNISYATGLPSYAATAWYHHKLPNQPKDLVPFLKQVEHYAMTDYLEALNLGNTINPQQKRKVAEQLHQYTGLPVDYILKDNLRIAGGQFAHELLGNADRITGRLDSRYSGPAMDPMGERGRYDPMDSSIDAPTVAEFNDYIRNTLHFGKGMHYRPSAYRQIYSSGGGWSFKHRQPGSGYASSGTPNVMPDLTAALKHNPNMNVLLMGGYFDLGTPFFAAEYEMYQLNLPKDLQDNISFHFFPSGHMVYLNPKAHDGLHDAAAKFIEANYKK